MKDIAILIKESSLDDEAIERYYINPLSKRIDRDRISIIDLPYRDNKATATTVKEWVDTVKDELESINYLYIADAQYFKTLCKETKAEANLGYKKEATLLDNKLATYGINHSQLIYNPELTTKLRLSLNTFIDIINKDFQELGTELFESAKYPSTREEIKDCLDELLLVPELTFDIETTGLYPHTSEILTIAFGLDKHNGVAFKYDKELLSYFFNSYKGKLIAHNAVFDIKHLIYHLYMDYPHDWKGLLHGLGIFKNTHDTMVLAYCALNSTTNYSVSLKELAHEFAGNYAQEDIDDAANIPIDELLEYNLTDTLCTWYVYEKYMPIVIEDNQLIPYESVLQPSIKLLVHTELSGMPIDMNKVEEVEKQLTETKNKALAFIERHNFVNQAIELIRNKELIKINSKLKKKQHGKEKVANLSFNVNSGQHLQVLLYDIMALEVIDITPSGQPSTGGGTIEKLLNHANSEQKELLNHILDYQGVAKILTAFIPAFKKAFPYKGHHYLYGGFRLGATVSGRLASSKPNLQNIPSGSTHGKLIKECFTGSIDNAELFVGADFSSLEERINTILTKDPNKELVYTDGYDGHSYRSFRYFQDEMPDIKLATTEKCYKIGNDYFKETDIVIYDNKKITIKELLNV